MAKPMTPEDSVALIKANLAEVLNPEIIDDVVLREKRPLRLYWGTAPTGRPHCGYFVPVLKIAEFLRAGCHVQILLADLHAVIDNQKSPAELVGFRAKYYELVVKSLLRSIGVDLSQLHFVLGSSYQKSGDYFFDNLKIFSTMKVGQAQRASAEVVKQSDDPIIGNLVYPIMQALDEEYLKVDAQFGGLDQRKIFALALETLPKIGYKVRAHLMNPMVPGLGEGGKMSASDPNSKIDILDDHSTVEKKLKKAVCVPKMVEGNGVIAFLEHVIFRALSLKHHGEVKFIVERRDENPLVYDNIEKVKEDYAADILTPQTLKPALTRELLDLLAPVQEEFKQSGEWQEIERKAYPSQELEKKAKKKKDKGDPAKREAAMLARREKAAANANASTGAE